MNDKERAQQSHTVLLGAACGQQSKAKLAFHCLLPSSVLHDNGLVRTSCCTGVFSTTEKYRIWEGGCRSHTSIEATFRQQCWLGAHWASFRAVARRYPKVTEQPSWASDIPRGGLCGLKTTLCHLEHVALSLCPRGHGGHNLKGMLGIHRHLEQPECQRPHCCNTTEEKFWSKPADIAVVSAYKTGGGCIGGRPLETMGLGFGSSYEVQKM